MRSNQLICELTKKHEKILASQIERNFYAITTGDYKYFRQLKSFGPKFTSGKPHDPFGTTLALFGFGIISLFGLSARAQTRSKISRHVHETQRLYLQMMYTPSDKKPLQTWMIRTFPTLLYIIFLKHFNILKLLCHLSLSWKTRKIFLKHDDLKQIHTYIQTNFAI